MTRLILSIMLAFLATQAHAEWRTTKALPIPYSGVAPREIISDEFSDYATNPQRSLEYVLFDTIDKDQLKSGAIPAWNYVLGLFSFDVKKLAVAGLPEPLIRPYLASRSGEIYFPYFFGPLKDTQTGSYGCAVPLIVLNGPEAKSGMRTFFAYESLTAQWNTGARARAGISNRLVATMVHELVHAIQGIQAIDPTDWKCPGKLKWISEGIANGIAHYLMSKRAPVMLERYDWARDERLYSETLVSNDGTEAYGSGSFFRYLFEATESNNVSDLSIARDLIKKISANEADNADLALKAVARVVENHSNRSFSIILAEFLTELASYSKRYKIRNDRWIRESFGECEEFNLLPGATQTIFVQVDAVAGLCIKVSWSQYLAPAALQIYAELPGTDIGNLHLGEAYRTNNQIGRALFCYDVTSRIPNRITNNAERKCILRRQATRIGTDGSGISSTNGWTSDFGMLGEGEAHFILTNAAKDISTTQPMGLELTLGSILVKDETGKTLGARKKVTNPVKEGRTLLDSRVHAMAGGPGRLLFDGRSVFGDGLDVGFLEGSPGAGEIDGAAVVARTGEYNVILIKDKTGFPNGGAIMREPDGSFSGAITTLGMKGMPEFPSCGFKIPAELTIHEQTKEQLSFRVSGDVFNMSRETMSGQGNLCDRLRSAHVEFKSIEVSLPWSANYDGTATIERAYPPMQDIYDTEEFRSGPSFGGIETSRSIVFGDEDPDDLDTEVSEQTSSPTGPTQSTSSSTLPPSCTCLCPGFVHPMTEPCFGRCETVLKQCTAPNTLADTISTNDSETNLYNDLLGSRDIPDEIREILTSDFRTMSPGTRRQIIRESAWEQAE